MGAAKKGSSEPSLDTAAVVVIGGGPIGLATFIGLCRAGVDAVLIEKHSTTARIPKALLLNQRTMEVFRQFGLEEDVRGASLPREEVGYLFHAESLTSDVFERVPMLSDSDKSAVAAQLCSQDALEPVLRAHAERLAPGKVLFGTRAEALTQDEDGVNVQILTTESGARRSLRAEYVVAADGAHSAVRGMVGIKMKGVPSLGHAVHVVFDAPIGPLVVDRASAMYYVKGGLLFVIVDGDRRWRLMINDYDPGAGEPDPGQILALIRQGVGVDDLEVTLEGVFAWQPSAMLSNEFRAGRVLLAGDAAHVRPPWGGLGMNAGIGDAHNVAWKLAEVLTDRAGADLLDTYGQERRPVAQRTIQAAIKNSGQAAKVSSPDPAVREAAARHRRAEGLVLGYTYASTCILPDGDESKPTSAEDEHAEYIPAARPGHRAPHFWIDNGRSVTDLFGDGFVLLTGRGGKDWKAAADGLAASGHDGLQAYVIGGADGDLPDPLDRWGELYCPSPEGAVLVRPDGHVAWRSLSLPEDPSLALRQALRSVLGRPEEHVGQLA